MDNKLIDLIRPDLRHFKPYSSARDEAKNGKIWLNANESPWDYSGAGFNRYPQKQPAFLLEKISRIYGVQPNQLALLRGSDEAIDLLTRLFCRAEKEAVMICPPTFGMYAVCAGLQGVATIELLLKKENDFHLDTQKILDAWTPAVKLIYICTPNNPTGNSIPEADIITLCDHFRGKSIVVVDEAYIEFSSVPSMATHIDQYDNLAVLRTFSKAYGLAGVRFGAVLAQAELIHWINAILPPYPLPSPTIEVVSNFLTADRLTKIQENIDATKQQREYLINELKKSPLIKKVWPSDANFILIEAFNGEKMMQTCMEQGIVLRSMQGKPGLENCIRMGVGTKEENKTLQEALCRLG
jgi:histidinol-phosphate aminotransferase